jgi:hypothetical protein
MEGLTDFLPQVCREGLRRGTWAAFLSSRLTLAWTPCIAGNVTFCVALPQQNLRGMQQDAGLSLGHHHSPLFPLCHNTWCIV